VTSHLASADGGEVPDLNVQVGNYSTAATDAAVSVAGPPLVVQRTYNSQDPRRSGAFGAGWSTQLDQRLVVDGDGSGNAVVTLASGQQLRFGRSPDGSFAPPPGVNLTLVHAAATPATPEAWTLRDATGTRRLFDGQGRLVTISDADARQQTYRYDTGATHPNQIVDVASGRSLWLTWTGDRLTAVATDPPGPGQPAPMWTYSYDADRLTKVCTPLSATSCTSYQYTDSSHYQATVLDGNPIGYWPLGEATGGVAANAAARSAGDRDGSYRAVTLGRAGALAGSSDTAAGFSATA
jgi:hypothetical protein